MTETGLTAIADPDLERLLAGVESGQLDVSEDASLRSFGLGHIAPAIAFLKRSPPSAIALAIRCALAERRRRDGAKLELVWTGPEAKVSEARDSAIVLRQLFERAQETVIVAGYSFDAGSELLRPLYEAIVGRGVRSTMFLHIEDDANRVADATSIANAAIARFLATNWPFGPPMPTIYYDPRTIAHGARASLHAKCVVVDERYSLVTSANFTDRGNSRNIEVGVLVDDSAFSTSLARQWLGLIDSGLVRRA